MDKSESIYVVWRGLKTGPYSEAEVRQMIAGKSVSAYHQLVIDGKGITVREWLRLDTARLAGLREAERIRVEEVARAEQPSWSREEVPDEAVSAGVGIEQPEAPRLITSRKRLGMLPWLVVGVVLAIVARQHESQKLSAIEAGMMELAALHELASSSDYQAGQMLEVLGRLQLGDYIGLGQMAQNQRSEQVQMHAMNTVLRHAHKEVHGKRFMWTVAATILGVWAFLVWIFRGKSRA